MDILIDFDGTCVKHEFPDIGEDIGAVPVLKKLIKHGHNLILFTMRSDHDSEVNGASEEFPDISGGTYLTDAVNWFKDNDIPLYGINVNPTQHTWTKSPKAYGNYMIDDIAIGTPLIYPDDDRPYVDWVKMECLLEDANLI